MLEKGQKIDEDGQVTLPLEALNLASKNLLGRPLPEARTEREALFRRLRQLRLIRSAGDTALEDSDAWLIIRPDITSLVTDTALAQLTTADTDLDSAADAGSLAARMGLPTTR